MPAKNAPPLSDAARGTVGSRDDLRPPGAPHSGIAPGQIDEAALAAATSDGAGEPIPPADVMAERGAFAGPPTPAFPQPPSADPYNAGDASEDRPGYFEE